MLERVRVDIECSHPTTQHALIWAIFSGGKVPYAGTQSCGAAPDVREWIDIECSHPTTQHALIKCIAGIMAKKLRTI